MDRPGPVSLREAFWVWLRIAALSFGGPAGQIAVMHRILVEEKRWIGEQRFLHALNYCMVLDVFRFRIGIFTVLAGASIAGIALHYFR